MAGRGHAKQSANARKSLCFGTLSRKRPDPDNDVSAWEERKFRLNACVYYPAKRHPGYGFTGLATGVRLRRRYQKALPIKIANTLFNLT